MALLVDKRSLWTDRPVYNPVTSLLQVLHGVARYIFCSTRELSAALGRQEPSTVSFAHMDNFGELAVKFQREGWLIPQSEVQFGKILGRGASGVTYSGECRGRRVAIKAYSPTILARDASSVRTEMEIMSSLRHPNIIEFVGLCLSSDPAAAALITAFASRGELGHALHDSRRIRRMSNEYKFRIAIGLARGIQHLHEKDVVHRDVKPANVLLDDDFNPMLTDFGFSRLIDDSGDMTGETGSYRYMAPEVTRHGKYSGKADVFSYAVIINELFTEEKPFEYQLPIEVARSVCKRSIRPSQKRIKNDRLRGIIARAWDQEPDRRPAWPEIISELEAIRDEMCPAMHGGGDKGIGKFIRKIANPAGNSSSALVMDRSQRQQSLSSDSVQDDSASTASRPSA